MSDYENVRRELMKRFGHKSGSFGRHVRFVNRTRQQNETLREYMENLEVLADNAHFDGDAKDHRLMEVFIRNVNDMDAKKKAIKINMKATEQGSYDAWKELCEIIRKLEVNQAVMELNCVEPPSANQNNQYN